MLAIERTSQNARARCLSATTRAGEEISVMSATAAQRIGEWDGDVLLPNDVGKARRPVLPVEGEHKHLS